jgi:enterochelin esterase family protein
MKPAFRRLYCCAVIFAALGFEFWTAPMTAGGFQVVKVVSPEVGPDRRVTFRLYAPAASKVAVVQLAPSPTQGQRPDAVTLPMRREGNVWTAMSAPLPPDIYSYKLSVDGTLINDPANRAVIEEILASTSKVAVPGALWTDTDAPPGRVARQKYTSAAMNGDAEDYLVYTPAGYDAGRREPYPVLYLLHGLGDSAASWITNGGVDLTLNTLIARRLAKPMVVVMPLSAGRVRMGLNASTFEKVLFDELIPRVEHEYHVSRDRATRALAGVSVGGAQALSIGMRRTDMFTSLGLFSVSFGTMGSAPGLPDPRELQIDVSPLQLVFVGSGTEEQGIFDESRSLGHSLQAKGIRVVAVEIKGQGHVWPVWRHVFSEFVQTLFQ